MSHCADGLGGCGGSSVTAERVGVVAARPGGRSQFSGRRRRCAHMDSGRRQMEADTYWTAWEKQYIIIGVVDNKDSDDPEYCP